MSHLDMTPCINIDELYRWHRRQRDHARRQVADGRASAHSRKDADQRASLHDSAMTLLMPLTRTVARPAVSAESRTSVQPMGGANG